MGGHFTTKTTVWTFWFLLCSVKSVFSTDLEFIQDLGFDPLLDITKVNISQDEYTRMMSIYLERLQATQELDVIPKLITFSADKNPRRWDRDINTRIRFRLKPSISDLTIQSASLRLLAPTAKNSMITIKVYQVLSARRRRLLDEQLVYLSEIGPKWCEFDVTSAVQDWTLGNRNLGFELACVDCHSETFKPVDEALSVLVSQEFNRRKRAPRTYEEGRRTDCSNVNSKNNNNKPRCCRHEMLVNFKTLQITSIIQPKSYEAGFCKGRCPLNYNHATNHSRIQNLVHRIDRNATPRACCAPSKLEPLEILRVDPHDATKLSVEKWDNMKVIECACS